MNTGSAAKRGRPSKFGRPSQVVALTLPEEVVRGLRRVDPDLGWAIVKLFEKAVGRLSPGTDSPPPAALAQIAPHRSLIVVNRSVVKKLPGINIIPLNAQQAFLALAPGRGIPDLELSIVDRLADPTVNGNERLALTSLRARLRKWRESRDLKFLSRGIIVVVTNGGHASRARTDSSATRAETDRD